MLAVCRQKVFFVLLQLNVHPIVKHYNLAVDGVNKSQNALLVLQTWP